MPTIQTFSVFDPVRTLPLRDHLLDLGWTPRVLQLADVIIAWPSLTMPTGPGLVMIVVRFQQGLAAAWSATRITLCLWVARFEWFVEGLHISARWRGGLDRGAPWLEACELLASGRRRSACGALGDPSFRCGLLFSDESRKIRSPTKGLTRVGFRSCDACV
jgi:hypothetical protein